MPFHNCNKAFKTIHMDLVLTRKFRRCACRGHHHRHKTRPQALQALQHSVAATEDALHAACVSINPASDGSEGQSSDDESDAAQDNWYPLSLCQCPQTLTVQHHAGRRPSALGVCSWPCKNRQTPWQPQPQRALRDRAPCLQPGSVTHVASAPSYWRPWATGRARASGHGSRGWRRLLKLSWAAPRRVWARQVRVATTKKCRHMHAQAGQAKLQQGKDSSKSKKRCRKQEQRRERADQERHEAALAAERGMFSWLNTTEKPPAKATAKATAPPPTHAHQRLQRHERVRRLQSKVQALKQTAARQQGNAGVHTQVTRQLAAAEEELARAQHGAASAASHDAQRSAVKKLLTF